jgi:hypothetical protein
VARNALLGGGPHLLHGGEDAALSTLAWPALVALPALLGVDLGRALAGAGLAAEIAAALLVRRLGERVSGSLAAGALAAAWLATHPVYLLCSLGGMETPLYVALLASVALAAIAGRPAAFALTAAALAWTRVEGLPLAVALLAWAGWARERSAPWASRPWLAAGALAALGAPLLHYALFESWLPATVAVKSASAPGSLSGALAVAGEMVKAPLGLSAYWLTAPSVHALFALVAVWGAARAARSGLTARLWPVLLPAALHVALFVGAGRAYAINFPWYFVPPLLAVAILAAIGTAPALEGLARQAPGVSPLLPGALVVALALAAGPSLESGIGRVRESFAAHRERAYAAAAVWIGRHAPGTALASNEVGALSFFSPPGTEIVDLFGLARRREDAGLPFLELLARRNPGAAVVRADFRYRREIDARFPGRYLWARLAAVEIGLEPALAARLAPFQEELPALYHSLDLEREPAGSRAPRR